MQIFRKISDLQDFLTRPNGNSSGREDKKQIGFVPTMGFLHEGHLSLVQRSREENPVTVVSIFVNPSQFNDNEDFQKYPRDEVGDLEMLEGVLGEEDCVFLPEELSDQWSVVSGQYEIPRNLKDCMCGRTRPGHFEGVVEVVGRFLRILNPPSPLSDKGGIKIKMYLGKKDYQQVKILEDFVDKCFGNVQVIECETVREEDGLAMSSRNSRLNEKDRGIAVNLYKEILKASKFLKIPNPKSQIPNKFQISNIKYQIIENLQKFPEIKIDYIEIRDANDLKEISEKTKNIIIAGAVFVGDVRLIDNVVVEI